MTPSGVQVASFGVATNRVWKTQQGEKKEDTQFHNVVVFGRQAEIAKQYLGKGSAVYIEGRLQTSSWDGQDGAKKYRTEIVTERLQLGPRSGGGRPREDGGAPAAHQSGAAKPKAEEKPEEIPTIDIEDDINPEDIPF